MFFWANMTVEILPKRAVRRANHIAVWPSGMATVKTMVKMMNAVMYSARNLFLIKDIGPSLLIVCCCLKYSKF